MIALCNRATFRTLLAASFLGSALVGTGVPVTAQIAPPAGPCATDAALPPAVSPQLDYPSSGASDVTTQPHRIDAQIFVPSAGGVAIDQMRVVLVDASPYATEAGIFGLDPSGPAQLPPPMAVPATVAGRGTTRYVTTWVPALKPNTHYDVRVVLPGAGNCIYATLGSFTTASPS